MTPQVRVPATTGVAHGKSVRARAIGLKRDWRLSSSAAPNPSAKVSATEPVV